MAENLEQKSEINFVKVAVVSTLVLALGIIPLLNGIDKAVKIYRENQKIKRDLEDLRRERKALENYEKFKDYLLNPQPKRGEEEVQRRLYKNKVIPC
ncbi:hypothetical protein COV15_01720 [Candidatus Woesearchaeota archaeon CG10_big_fil_rev_8_21_14_0_10_34_12]|nr:MAG: hypothetical protein COV15_01720 [Candidatus Woesearchaeota archaeon CG10_big_fil_rev_8_21_14_0_10_34_12]